METRRARYRSNLNFTVMFLFGLIVLTLGFYMGTLTSRGSLTETLQGKDNATVYQHIWINRTDIFNVLLAAIAYALVMLVFLVVFGRFKINRNKLEDIQSLERLGALYDKGLLTREEFDRKKSELLGDEEK